MIAFASYNKFNNNIVLDTWAISLTNSITSLLAGTIVFSTLGNIAFEQGKDIDDVVAEGKAVYMLLWTRICITAANRMTFSWPPNLPKFTFWLEPSMQTHFVKKIILVISKDEYIRFLCFGVYLSPNFQVVWY